MSKKAAEHHKQSAEHHTHAARHHSEAATVAGEDENLEDHRSICDRMRVLTALTMALRR